MGRFWRALQRPPPARSLDSSEKRWHGQVKSVSKGSNRSIVDNNGRHPSLARKQKIQAYIAKQQELRVAADDHYHKLTGRFMGS